MKTFEEKIEELDKMFEGFAVEFNQFDKKDILSVFEIKLADCHLWCWNRYIHTNRPLIMVFGKNKTIHASGKTLSDCIDKAHDYFIVKGGEL